MAARHGAAIEALGGFREVRVACLKGEPTLERALDGVRAPVHAVPLLLADGFIMDLLRRRLEDRPEVTLHPPLGQHPGLIGLARRKALEACAGKGWGRGEATLLLVGHGTPRHPRSTATTEAAAAAIAAGALFKSVRTAYLDQGSYLAEVAGGLRDGPCVAVGLFMDEGPHGRDDVLEGLQAAPVPVAYAGPIGGDGAVVKLILAQAGTSAQPRERVDAE